MTNQRPLSTNAESKYSLTADDLDALVVLIHMQSDVSPTAGALTKGRLLDFIAGLTFAC